MSSEPAEPDDQATRTTLPQPAARSSLRGLDGLNFLMADVRDGLGPFLSVFLTGSEHWRSGNIGVVMAASSLAAAVCQIPAGMLVDSLRAKRLLAALSGLLVAAASLLIVTFPRLPVLLCAQIALGAAAALIPPCIASPRSALASSDTDCFLHGSPAMKASIMLVTSLAIIAIQLLDGVEAGIFGVVAVVITSDLMRGSGRFNVAQGLMALCVGIGAALSNVLGGFFVEHAGFVAAYLILAVIAAIAFVVFASLMPETGHEAASLSCAFVTGRFER